ncbi:Phytocyanin domain containing protein [Trema orientale]|uniref:Phytocyanin domain containing protein n=1 Tax=Trema orientale TaxID=63057 RepID=A0A2P5C0Z7_TREOI|nr:Phytocyanin domain containing protein [Trema orientale]
MASRMGLIGCSLIIMVAMLKGANAELYVVGDSFGWNTPPNTTFYSEWANSKTFEIGDDVLFNWTGTHTVAELSTRAEYDNCTKPGIVFDSGFTWNLFSNGSRFFICTVDDHCEHGMKVIITVGSPTNTSAVSTKDDANSASSLSIGALLASLSAIVVSFLSYV